MNRILMAALIASWIALSSLAGEVSIMAAWLTAWAWWLIASQIINAHQAHAPKPKPRETGWMTLAFQQAKFAVKDLIAKELEPSKENIETVVEAKNLPHRFIIAVQHAVRCKKSEEAA